MLKCRKLLTVASVKAQQQLLLQQEQDYGHINDDEDDKPGDSLAVRELKHATAVLAGQHTEL